MVVLVNYTGYLENGTKFDSSLTVANHFPWCWAAGW
jgi:FKBP-type peptidyl-prolyl cis-trans isomerase